MKNTLAALALAALAALIPGSAAANLIVGINDDVKYEGFSPPSSSPRWLRRPSR